MSTKCGRLMEVCIPLCFLLLSGRAMAAPPPLTTIQDEIFLADGSPYSGFVEIEWNSFETEGGAQIAKQALRLRLFRGKLRVQLTPTTTATPAAFYKVKYLSDGKTLFTETWNVPPSSDTLRVRDVRASLPGTVVGGGGSSGSLETVTIADVEGLQAALDERPRAGAGFVPGRTAMINTFGELDSVVGFESDCVKVDGSAEVCGTGGAPSFGAQFIDAETPSGTIDGTNTVFTLSDTPSPSASLLLYRNGILQKAGGDFHLSGATISFVTAATPQVDDILTAVYRISGSPLASSQVLCSSSGTATNQTGLISLGTCTIPANVLLAGDRIEVSFHYTHEGGVSGFEHQLVWGGSALVNEGLPSTETAAVGRFSVAAGTAMVYWSGQSWGSTSAMATMAGSEASTFSEPITIDFQAQLTAASPDTVTLRNFSVIRHPNP
ncbi:MAG: hypothetical protein IPJ98_04925 [Bryobacterales bacterium]|nr:hypothetical protein [Bryobacterales bacterium]